MDSHTELKFDVPNKTLAELLEEKKKIEKQIRVLKQGHKIKTKSRNAVFGWTETNTRFKRREWRVWLYTFQSGYCLDTQTAARVIISAENKDDAIAAIQKAIEELEELQELVTKEMNE